MLQTYPQVFDLFVLLQFLKERLEKVRPLHVPRGHTQGIDIGAWKKREQTSALMRRGVQTDTKAQGQLDTDVPPFPCAQTHLFPPCRAGKHA